jgi:uncharacterized membrane protein
MSVVVYHQLPDQIAIHFDSAGNPDNYLPKAAAAFGLPVFLMLINLYVHFRVNKDPKAANASHALKNVWRWAVPVLSIVIMPITLFLSMGAAVPIAMIATAMAGSIVALCGNYLPKCKRNYTIGIKLPWTLDNEDNWFMTHRFAGFVWVIGGLVITANAFLRLPYITIGAAVLLLAVPFVYSYLYFRKHAGDNQ